MPSAKLAKPVKKISPTKTEARDEGPRLIPLETTDHGSEGRLNYYVRLANKELGLAENHPAVLKPPARKKR